jgi:hypothetical protein
MWTALLLRGAMSRLRPVARHPQVTIRQPMEWLLQATRTLLTTQPARGHRSDGCGGGLGLKQNRGDAMKIYLLMLLISVIATLSHIDFGRKSPQREA